VAERHALTPWDTLLMGLLVGSVALVFWHDAVVDATQRAVLEWIDLALVAVFVAEWGWRVARSPTPARFAVRHSWELLGMIPLMLPAPGVLRVLRLVRLVRILRVLGRLGEAIGAWERIAKESNLGKIGLSAGGVTLLGSFLVWLLERDDNPNLAHFSEALWWAVVTVTTVGYGDITPATVPGRVLAGMLMLVGIGTIGLLASSLASVLITQRQDASPSAPPVHGGRLASDLQALSELHRRGELSDEEYRLAKERVLGGVPGP
jgi:voltage-gated potassium channel